MTLIDLEDINFLSNNAARGKTLDYVESNDLKYSDFFKNYLYLNKPCVLKGVSRDWECHKLWVLDCKPNLNFLKEKYGSAQVPVANCNEKYYNAQSKLTMSLAEYEDYWQSLSSALSDCKPCLYLKDWHFQRDYPKDKVYKLPLHFASDWLNEFLLRNPSIEDDYRFVYIGPKGSWTPFHYDVFSSFSWSVNVCGKKKWVFYPPGEEKHLCDRFGNLTYSVESEDLKDKKMFPYQVGLVPPLVLIQNVGDAVFVPSGWHHQVWNLEDTLSINHNWINACNIMLMWEDMVRKLKEVEIEIQDCKDMEGWSEHCQLLLKSVYGMDILQFLDFIFYTAEVRLQALKENGQLETNLSEYIFGKNHILYDLISLNSVFKSLLKTNLSCTFEKGDKISGIIESIDCVVC